MTNKMSIWNTPKKSLFKALIDFINCVSFGYECSLIRIDNEKCNPFIKRKNPILNNINNWSSSYGTPENRKELEEKKYFNKIERELTLNYYYNFNNYLCCNGHNFIFLPGKTRGCPKCGEVNYKQSCKIKKRKKAESVFFYTHWKPKQGIPYYIPDNIGKVWVIKMENKKVNLITKILYLLKWIPRKSILNIGNCKNITFRIGSISNGYSVEIQIPKKFSFKDR